jgi:pimeloyl-ACP methyl ester carboxylesterase
MRPVSRVLLALFGVLLVGGYIVLNPPLDVPTGEQSHKNYQRGPHRVSHQSVTWTDTSRPTMANGDFKGLGLRKFKGRIWFPEDNAGAPYPLVVYSHGYMSQYKEGEYILEFLASHGFVAVSVDFPLSNGSSPGGAVVSDIANQAGDVSFLIDQMLARSKQADNLLNGRVDPDRIAAVGLSLGGLTTELATFDARTRDPRIRAAVSMAGPSQFLTKEFFDGTTVPFMYIGGTADAIVPYRENAQPIPKKYKDSLLVTLNGGSHLGFIDMAPRVFRWFDNPDKLGCVALMHGLKAAQEAAKTGQPSGQPSGKPSGKAPANFGTLIGGPGIDAKESTPPCQMQEFPRAMRPARQHMLVTLAIYSFLESQFSASQTTRQEMYDYLINHLSQENPDVIASASDYSQR